MKTTLSLLFALWSCTPHKQADTVKKTATAPVSGSVTALLSGGAVSESQNKIQAGYLTGELREQKSSSGSTRVREEERLYIIDEIAPPIQPLDVNPANNPAIDQKINIRFN